MRILVSNDDGVEAPGLARLAAAARTLAGEVFVVAPERKWTAASHQLSFDRTLTLSRRGERVFACSGAPADCVVAAMTLVFADGTRPDLVLAGINDKLNVGEDLAYSGTMAIAREASFWGVPSIAMSRDAPSSANAAEAEALARLLQRPVARRARTGTDRGCGSRSTCRNACRRRSSPRAWVATRSAAPPKSSSRRRSGSPTGWCAGVRRRRPPATSARRSRGARSR